MIIYKYKSLEGEGFFHAIDMIACERIFLTDCNSVNDPDECCWEVVEHENKTKYPDKEYLELARRVRQITDKQRFTCFTTGGTNPLLWAHYAGGFSGISIEYEADETLIDLRPIEYTGKANITLEQLQRIAEKKILPQDAGILKTKADCWHYEGEIRAYGSSASEKYLSCIKPKAIILGVKESRYDDVFNEISRRYNINIAYLSLHRKQYSIVRI